jgi:hydroxyacylglutathione hydrolase
VPHLREVAAGVLVGTSRFMTTNTVVVTHDGRALVIDPGVHEDELEAIGVELLRRRLTPVAGFATHAHWDHVLWHAELGDDVPRYATATTATVAAASRAELVEQAEETTPVDAARLGVLRPVGDHVPWEGPAAAVVAHDAHQAGHAALHLPELGLLVAGDMGSDVEVPLLDPDVPGPEALLRHHDGLDRLAGLAPVDLVVTGHGHVCDGAAWRQRLDDDRRYLDDLAAGWPSGDPRLVEGWLRDADAAMRAGLTKDRWRRWVRSRPPVDEAVAAGVVGGLETFLGRAPGVVAAYEALPGEVDLRALLDGMAVHPEAVALPWVDEDGTLRWHGGVDPTSFDVVLVPGRLFDRHGIRLGRGGGHYDRLLPGLRPGTPVVGVTVDDRVVPRLPTEAHDAPMTHLATESGVRAIG